VTNTNKNIDLPNVILFVDTKNKGAWELRC
jgi:hypothetical protein